MAIEHETLYMLWSGSVAVAQQRQVEPAMGQRGWDVGYDVFFHRV